MLRRNDLSADTDEGLKPGQPCGPPQGRGAVSTEAVLAGTGCSRDGEGDSEGSGAEVTGCNDALDATPRFDRVGEPFLARGIEQSVDAVRGDCPDTLLQPVVTVGGLG